MAQRPRRHQELDRVLVRSCLEGAPGAWEALVREKTPFLSRMIRGSLARSGARVDEGRVQDVLQDVFASLSANGCASLRRFQGDCALDTYLASIAVYRCLDAARLHRGKELPGQDGGAALLWRDLAAAGSVDPALAAQERERAERVERAMSALPPKDRLALRLFYWSELPASALARVLRISPDSVWPRLMRARERLRETLRGSASLL